MLYFKYSYSFLHPLLFTVFSVNKDLIVVVTRTVVCSLIESTVAIVIEIVKVVVVVVVVVTVLVCNAFSKAVKQCVKPYLLAFNQNF